MLLPAILLGALASYLAWRAWVRHCEIKRALYRDPLVYFTIPSGERRCLPERMFTESGLRRALEELDGSYDG